jgi:hypothetical protein
MPYTKICVLLAMFCYIKTSLSSTLALDKICAVPKLFLLVVSVTNYKEIYIDL